MTSLARRLSLAAALALAVPSTTTAAPAASARSRHVTATLVAESRTLRPGSTLAVGLHLAMAPEWHTYWKNPGDSGLPTRIQWRLPEGFEAGPVLWPAPQRMFVDPLMSYGYGGEVLLLTEIRTPAKLPAGGSAAIGAKVDWLECKEACLPGKAELLIELPVSAAVPEALPEWSARFAETRRRLPAASGGWTFEAWPEGGALRLAASGPTGASAREAYFFPAQPEVIEHAARQELRAGAGRLELVLARAANGRIPERLSGVLVVDGTAVDVAVPVAAARPPGAAGPLAPAAGGLAPGAVAASLPAALLLSFVGGLILNLMPCVLPVLALKVMSFVRHGSGSRHGALRHGLAFTGGVLVFFWLLAGALLALRAGGEQIGWGFQLQSPGFVVFLSALFLLLSLNLLGVFEVGESLTAAGNLEGRASGLPGSFLSGALATLVATPCTAPFMGSALGFALGQPPPVTLLVFTFLGLGMAAPYLALSASPRLLRLVPKPGRWMETLKQLMGFVLLATVVFLLWLFGRQAGVGAMAGLLAALLLVSLGAWVYGRAAHPRAGALSYRLATVAAAALVAGGLVLGLAQAQAAPREDAAPAGAASGSAWEPFSPERLEALRAAGTPVFVDFTADWCLTCQVNERVVLSRPEVQQSFRAGGVVLMKADWTLRDERITRALAAHGRQGVPAYALYGRDPRQPPRLLPEVLSPALVRSALEESLGTN